MKHAVPIALGSAVLVGVVFLAQRGLDYSATPEVEVIPFAPPPQTVQEPAPAPDDFVPNLPAVPDLSQRRPNAPESGSAPRTAQEGAFDSLTQEMNLMREARSMMVADATGAMTLLEQHRARFPEGALLEEREAYSVLAMIALGRPEDEVERRYLDLLARFPESRYAPDIRTAMQARRERNTPN